MKTLILRLAAGTKRGHSRSSRITYYFSRLSQSQDASRGLAYTRSRRLIFDMKLLSMMKIYPLCVTAGDPYGCLQIEKYIHCSLLLYFNRFDLKRFFRFKES